jgi:ABC-type amino acid transport substrate-binding protein
LGATATLAALPVTSSAAPLGKVKELGVLRVAVYKDNWPWSALRDGKPTGIDVEIAQALAKGLGVRTDVAEITADESVDDDLRNAIWRGGLLGFAPADVMMHVPFDRAFGARNDQVALFAPYYRESFQLACNKTAVDCEAPPVQFRGKRLAAELDSIPDFYLLGTFGGILAKDVVHFPSGAEAALAVAGGQADVVIASKAQIEAMIHETKASNIARRKMPLPAFSSPGWDIGMAVKENSRTLSDALETILGKMTDAGELAAIFARYGVAYTPALAG